MADFVDEKTSEENLEKFIRRVAASGVVYWLNSPNGSAQSESTIHDDDEEAPTVLLFFSDTELARTVCEGQYPNHHVAQMSLFEFLYRWLPGMTNDDVKAGLDWRADLCGPEGAAVWLREKIDDALPSSTRLAHEEQCTKIQEDAKKH